MVEKWTLAELAQFLTDIERVLGYMLAQDGSAMGRLQEIDGELEQALERKRLLEGLLQRPLGAVTAVGEDVNEPKDIKLAQDDQRFCVAGKGSEYWSEMHASLFVYFSWLIHKRKAEICLPQLEKLLMTQKRYLAEVMGYVGQN